MTRTVVVSGGGTGIGRAVAARFAAGGDRLVLIGRRAEVLAKAAADLPGDPLVLPGDLAEAPDAARLAAAVAAQAGPVDVLVAAAGGNAEFDTDGPDGDGPAAVAARWTANFTLNTLTAVLLVEGLRPHLAHGARVVLLSSIAAYRGSGTGSYAASKAALHPYAYDLAAALGDRGITVNVVAPGYIADTEFFRGRLSEQRERTLVTQTSTGRAGRPDDVAETVHWLASPGAGHVTAQVVQVNGGAERGH